jgi:hypothetical protein
VCNAKHLAVANSAAKSHPRCLFACGCRCAAPERWCADLSSCSYKGVCSKALAAAMGSSTSTSSTAARYVPPVDKTPPQLKLLGTGTAAVTASGAIMLMEDVPWRSSWEDAGATAIDAVDGNLTSRVQAFGAGKQRASPAAAFCMSLQ